jgi:hypothetical protein
MGFYARADSLPEVDQEDSLMILIDFRDID